MHLLQANDGNGNGRSPRPDGDCYVASCQGSSWAGSPDWGVAGLTDDDPSLDLDDIPGTGPENINIFDPSPSHPGWYQVFVHDYPNTVNNYNPNDVTVNIYLDGVLAQTFNFQMTGEDTDHYVAKIQWPQGNIVACNGLAGCP